MYRFGEINIDVVVALEAFRHDFLWGTIFHHSHEMGHQNYGDYFEVFELRN